MHILISINHSSNARNVESQVSRLFLQFFLLFMYYIYKKPLSPFSLIPFPVFWREARIMKPHHQPTLYYTWNTAHNPSSFRFYSNFCDQFWRTCRHSICNCEEDFVLADCSCKMGGMQLVNHHRSRICQNKLRQQTLGYLLLVSHFWLI